MIRMTVNTVPISTNAAYIKGRGGRRILSQEGAAYKLDTKTYLTATYFAAINRFAPDPHEPISCFVQLSMPIYNDTFGAAKGAKTRYKKLDVSNRQKLLEDVLAEVLGVDDANNVTVIFRKKDSRELRTDILLWLPEKEASPFDELAESLLQP